MKLERPLVVLDMETTGVDPMLDRIVEFGAVQLNVDGSRKKFEKRFNPGMPIPPGATEVHGITDADVKDLPSFSSVAASMHKWLQGRDVAGYNLRRFDLPILDTELRRVGLKLEMEGRQVIDVFTIFTKKEPRKLEDAVRRYCKRELEGAHGAGADAAATLDVLLAQVGEYEDMAAMGVAELSAFSNQDDKNYVDLCQKLYLDADGDVCYAFGKNKDKKIKQEIGYAHWMLDKASFPASTVDALRAELARI